jgi:hypothetical protein
MNSSLVCLHQISEPLDSLFVARKRGTHASNSGNSVSTIDFDVVPKDDLPTAIWHQRSCLKDVP